MQGHAQKVPSAPAAQYAYSDLCSQEFPWPALARGWLHCRLLAGPWDLERLAGRLGDGLWLSYYLTEGDHPEGDDPLAAKPQMLAGYWPGGGFIKAYPCRANAVEHPQSNLFAYAASPAAALRLLEVLRADFLIREPARFPGPRIALLNANYNSLEVHRVRIDQSQLIARTQADLFYGDGAAAWMDAWTAQLQARRYGLSVLSGAPGTGKTTLLRSLAHWLNETHLFYYIPAARFCSVEAGEIVTFWANENRGSPLRKVLVLEDAESVLLRRATDNREQVATLLNLTDGIMGDALGLQIICTLNSDLTDLDPALLRPGRLLAQRDFRPLSAAAAHRLAAHLGKTAPAGDEISLAELFAPPAAGLTPAKNSRTIGFHMTATF